MSAAGFLAKLLNGGEVAWKPLSEVVGIQRGRRLVRSQLEETGKFAVFQNSMKPLGFYHDSNVEADTTFVICAGAAGEIGYSASKFWAADDVHFFQTPNWILSKYIYHWLLTQQSKISSQVRRASIPRLSKSVLELLVLPIPCPDDPQKSLAIQGEIVRILDSFTELTAELTAELTQRKKQYNHYRDQLLSFDEGKVEWKALGSLTRIKTGQLVNKKIISANPGQFPVINSGREPLGFLDDWNTQDDPIGITSRGAGVGSVTWQEGRYFRGNLNYSVTIRSHGTLDVHYLYHVLEQYQPQIKELCTFDGIPALNAVNLKKLSIPVPSLVEQKRIAAVLDTFDMLTTSLTEGLPREIALREKQYAWYRDHLLSFPKPDEEAA